MEAKCIHRSRQIKKSTSMVLFMYNKTEVIKLSKIIFTPEQIDLLSRNKYVKSVSEKAITYTNEFKIQFIADTNNGKTATQIFSEAGLDPQILGKERIHKS